MKWHMGSLKEVWFYNGCPSSPEDSGVGGGVLGWLSVPIALLALFCISSSGSIWTASAWVMKCGSTISRRMSEGLIIEMGDERSSTTQTWCTLLVAINSSTWYKSQIISTRMYRKWLLNLPCNLMLLQWRLVNPVLHPLILSRAKDSCRMAGTHLDKISACDHSFDDNREMSLYPVHCPPAQTSNWVAPTEEASAAKVETVGVSQVVVRDSWSFQGAVETERAVHDLWVKGFRLQRARRTWFRASSQ